MRMNPVITQDIRGTGAAESLKDNKLRTVFIDYPQSLSPAVDLLLITITEAGLIWVSAVPRVKLEVETVAVLVVDDAASVQVSYDRGGLVVASVVTVSLMTVVQKDPTQEQLVLLVNATLNAVVGMLSFPVDKVFGLGDGIKDTLKRADIMVT